MTGLWPMALPLANHCGIGNLRLAFYATPYTNGGLLLGWLDMTNGAGGAT